MGSSWLICWLNLPQSSHSEPFAEAALVQVLLSLFLFVHWVCKAASLWRKQEDMIRNCQLTHSLTPYWWCLYWSTWCWSILVIITVIFLILYWTPGFSSGLFVHETVVLQEISLMSCLWIIWLSCKIGTLYTIAVEIMWVASSWLAFYQKLAHTVCSATVTLQTCHILFASRR